jgi:hypothetical protein
MTKYPSRLLVGCWLAVSLSWIAPLYAEHLSAGAAPRTAGDTSPTPLASKLIALGYDRGVAQRLAARFPELETMAEDCLKPVTMYRGLARPPKDYLLRWAEIEKLYHTSFVRNKEIYLTPDLKFAFDYALRGEKNKAVRRGQLMRTVIELQIPRCLYVAPEGEERGKPLPVERHQGILDKRYVADLGPFLRRMGVVDLRGLSVPHQGPPPANSPESSPEYNDGFNQLTPDAIHWLRYNEAYDEAGRYIGPR